MTLMDVIENLWNFRTGLLTIYVEEPWTPESAVALADQPDVSGPGSAAQFDGKPYFMEISTAQEFLDGVEEAPEKLSLRQQCERLIFYALNDA